nr:glycoside hydrolase family 16 protein [uncultured Prevotella sp.]
MKSTWMACCLLMLLGIPGMAKDNKTNKSNKYKLVWQEDFKGDTFDAKSWSKIPRDRPDWKRHMSYDDRLYEVKDGKLILYGVNNDGTYQYDLNGDGKLEADTARFVTGGLYTKHKKTIEYGKVEVRAKLGQAQGAWPAIWMLPDRENAWPMGGEIDIMEHLNYDPMAYQTVHTYYTHILKLDSNPPHFATGKIDTNGYNVYAVEILPDELIFSINGEKTFSYPRIQTDKEGQYPFGAPFYLLIDMQIEGSWVGKADPSQLPVKMEIDWVKMYKLKK